MWRTREGKRVCVAQLWIARPSLRSVPEAEAAGLGAGLALVRALVRRPSSLLVMGDRIGTLRWAAGNARLGSAAADLASAAVSYATRHRWPVQWLAVPRAFNCTAHALAGMGAAAAGRGASEAQGWSALGTPAALPWLVGAVAWHGTPLAG